MLLSSACPHQLDITSRQLPGASCVPRLRSPLAPSCCMSQPSSSSSRSTDCRQAPLSSRCQAAGVSVLGSLSQQKQRRGDSLSCAAGPNRDRPGAGQSTRDAQAKISLNPTYLVIVGIYAGLLALKNPYIFAGLSIATIIPQNSTTTSLNSLVLFFYDSGLFQNFAEAVYCVRLMTWLSIGCSLVSFALFA